MRYNRHICASIILPGVLLVCLTAGGHAQPAPTNEVLTWNETAVKASTAGGQNTVQLSRAIAMVQGAVHDALNAINRRYAAYYFEESGAPGARRPGGSPREATPGRPVPRGASPAPR